MCNERREKSLLFSISFLFEKKNSIDVLAEHVATVVGSIASVGLHNCGGWQEDQSSSTGAQWLQHILLGAVSHAGVGHSTAIVSSSDCSAAEHKLLIAGGAHHFYVLGRSECLRGSNFEAFGAGRDAGH